MPEKEYRVVCIEIEPGTFRYGLWLTDTDAKEFQAIIEGRWTLAILIEQLQGAAQALSLPVITVGYHDIVGN